MPFNLTERARRAPAANPGLGLLIRLRWLALAGQAVLFWFSASVLKMDLPMQVLLPCMGLTALTNLAAAGLCAGGRRRAAQGALCGLLLVLDTLTLTVMLLATGGSHNPFAIFYLLHVAIATVLLSYRMAWAMVALAGLCYASLFVSGQTLASLSGQEFCGSFDFHLHGMLLSMVLVGMGLAFFIGKLKIALAHREAELELARSRSERNERFAALATLAAGVAHELATPLGTIALAGEDLEQQAGEGCRSGGCLRDARLIRSEVQRCCAVLEKLRLQTTDGAGDAAQEMALGEIPTLLAPYLGEAHRDCFTFVSRSRATSARLPQTALLQSLAVLVKNACEAGGKEAHKAVLSVEDAAHGLRFSVEDQGRGMTPETIARLGEPFFTTKEPGRGMGLGLFLVRMFVDRVGGKLEVDSVPGSGTRVSITIATIAGSGGGSSGSSGGDGGSDGGNGNSSRNGSNGGGEAGEGVR